MTDTQEAAPAENLPKAPAGHYYATFKDRRILIKSINTAQSMILGGLLRQLDQPRGAEDYLAALGKIMRLVESLLVEEDDMKWLEDGILDGVLDIEDFGIIFLPVTDEAPAEKKERRPRRGK